MYMTINSLFFHRLFWRDRKSPRAPNIDTIWHDRELLYLQRGRLGNLGNLKIKKILSNVFK